MHSEEKEGDFLRKSDFTLWNNHWCLPPSVTLTSSAIQLNFRRKLFEKTYHDYIAEQMVSGRTLHPNWTFKAHRPKLASLLLKQTFIRHAENASILLLYFHRKHKYKTWQTYVNLHNNMEHIACFVTSSHILWKQIPCRNAVM